MNRGHFLLEIDSLVIGRLLYIYVNIKTFSYMYSIS